METHQFRKLVSLVSKINRNDFDNAHVDSLLIFIRNHTGQSFRNRNIYDICHFVAHSQIRDRGKMYNNLMMLSYIHRFNLDNAVRKYDKLDFPSYIKQFFKIYLQQHQEEEFVFDVAYGYLKKVVNGLVITADTINLQHKEQDVERAMMLMTMTRVPIPFMNEDEFISELEESLEYLGVPLKIHDKLEIKNKLFLCLLILLHRTTFSNEDFTLVSTITKSDLGNNKTYLDLTWDVSFNINMEFHDGLNIKQHVGYSLPLIVTRLEIKDHCSPQLIQYLQIRRLSGPAAGMLPENVYLDSSDFKLSM